MTEQINKRPVKNLGASAGEVPSRKPARHARRPHTHSTRRVRRGRARSMTNGRHLVAIVGGEPCINTSDGRVLCGEPCRTRGGEVAMLFASFDMTDGVATPVGACVMPIEALADAVRASRIVSFAGDAM